MTSLLQSKAVCVFVSTRGRAHLPSNELYLIEEELVYLYWYDDANLTHLTEMVVLQQHCAQKGYA